MSKRPSDPWMTLADVMRALDVGRLAVLTHVRKGDIRKRETSAHRRYLLADVEKLVAAQEKQTA